MITPCSIHLTGRTMPNGTCTTSRLFRSDNTLSFALTFFGRDLTANPNWLSITYGPFNSQNLFACQLLTTDSDDSQVSCTTQMNGAGRLTALTCCLLSLRALAAHVWTVVRSCGPESAVQLQRGRLDHHVGRRAVVPGSLWLAQWLALSCFIALFAE